MSSAHQKLRDREPGLPRPTQCAGEGIHAR